MAAIRLCGRKCLLSKSTSLVLEVSATLGESAVCSGALRGRHECRPRSPRALRFARIFLTSGARVTAACLTGPLETTVAPRGS